MDTMLLEVRPLLPDEQAFLTLRANGTFPDAFLPQRQSRALVLSSDSFDEGYFLSGNKRDATPDADASQGNRLLIVRYHGENRWPIL